MKNTIKQIEDSVNRSTENYISFLIENYNKENKVIDENNPFIKFYKRGCNNTLQTIKEILEKL